MNESLAPHNLDDLTLLCRPTRALDEGMYGFLLRLAEANGLAGISQLWLGRKPSIDVLERRLGAQHWPQNGTVLNELRPQLTNLVGKRSIWNPRHSRYCPCCLKESPRWKWEWEMRLFTSCPQHGIELLEHCSSCGNKLTWGRKNLMECDCGFCLASADFKTVSQLEQQLAEIFRARLYGLSIAHSHLSKLSLEQLHRVAFMLGAYAKNDGRKFSQKISNLHDLEVARPLMNSAAQILMNWPRGFHSLLASLRKTGDIDVQDQRLSKRFGFFYHYVYRNLKEPEYAFILQAFEEYISRTWRGSLAERNSRLSPNMRRGHTWVPISAMAKELKTTKRQLQLLINEGRIESHVSKTQMGRSLVCVSRQQIVTMRMALDNVLDLTQTCHLLGLTKSRTTQLLHGKVIEAIFQPQGAGTSRWGIPQRHVEALVSLGSELPIVSESERPDLISLAHTLRYRLQEAHLFPSLVLAVIRKDIMPLAASNSLRGLPSWLFDLSALLAWFSDQRRVVTRGFISIPDAARKLGIRQQALYQFVYRSQLRVHYHHDGRYGLIDEKDLEKFANSFVFSHELQAQFKLLPSYFISRLLARGVRPVSDPKVDSGQIYLFSRDPTLFDAMNEILKGRKPG